jgi:hypothetical protein
VSSEDKFGQGTSPQPFDLLLDHLSYTEIYNNLPLLTHRSHAHAIASSSCEGGRYSKGLAVNCSICETGTFATSSESSTCTECDAGKFSDTGALSCTNCDDGTSSSNGSGVCFAYSPYAPHRVNVTDIQPENLRVAWNVPVYEGWYQGHLTKVKQYGVSFNRTNMLDSTVLTHYVETAGNETFINLNHGHGIEQYSYYQFEVRARSDWGWGPWSDPMEGTGMTGIFGSITVSRDEWQDEQLVRAGGPLVQNN